MGWLIASVVLSIVLTVLLNVAVRAFPGAGERAAKRLDEMVSRADERPGRVRVVAPWKTMLVVSLVLTVLFNIALR
jgi:hypothetical protein